jgi:hypothetical protein
MNTRTYPVLASLLVLVAACSDESPAVPSAPGGWGPGRMMKSLPESGPRGLLDVRGLIHAHSVYSHDACDGKPRDEDTGDINEPCFEDFRRDMCAAGHNFIMLSDHRTSFGHTEYPDTLLYRASRGDELIEEAGAAPRANWAACDDGGPVLIMAGCEAGTMPVGLEHHVSDDISERQELYGDVTDEAIAAHKKAGAVVLVAHTENWSVEELSTLPLDGFEMYNLHANLMAELGAALDVILKLNSPELLPQSDLILLPILAEDSSYLDRWSGVLASGARRVTTMGTDCHRNSFPSLLPDGERVDSYRRMMMWFSNHLLIDTAGGTSWDDRDLKAALRAGRLYGAFEFLGYPSGFDFYAEAGGMSHEMGEEIAATSGVSLHVSMPTLRDLSVDVEPPALMARILLATPDGWQLVAEDDTDLEVAIDTVGAYRAEVRIKPLHLKSHLGSYVDLADREVPWIYSNAIYITP